MTDRELLQQALDVLEDWDSLIQHQYNGSKKAMSDLTICAQSTPPIIDAIKARLAQLEPHCKTGSQCVAGQCKRCQIEEHF